MEIPITWALCDSFCSSIKIVEKTEVFLKNNILNKFTQNKAISKIHDSYRVNMEDKELLNKYKK